MGIDTARFSGDIDGDLLCPICSFVLEEPVWAPTCEHVFCNTCITEWLTSNQTCPIDRTNLTNYRLKPAPRILRNFLSRLTLSCSNQTHGCTAFVTVERLEAHILECPFNPRRLVTCQSGCGTSIPFEELQNHNCFQSLKFEMESTLTIVQKENEEKISEMQSELDLQAIAQKENEEKISEMQSELDLQAIAQKENEEKMSKVQSELDLQAIENEEKMSKMQSELDLLKAEINTLKKGNPGKQSTSSDSQLLPTAGQSQAVNQLDIEGTVLTDSRWITESYAIDGCCLSDDTAWRVVLRPCHLMLEVATKTLTDSGCPLEMVKTLIENSIESRWPPGVRSQEARRANRDRIRNYRCRIILKTFSSHTFIIIMASDNAHMEQDIFVINPGFLFFLE